MVDTDAGIARWDSKYHYLFWRPVTAILHADIDGNAATTAARRARAQADFDRIFQLSPDLIAVADFDGRFTRVNPPPSAFSAIRRTSSWSGRASASSIQRIASRRRPKLAFENSDVRKDGSRCVLEWTVTPVARDRRRSRERTAG